MFCLRCAIIFADADMMLPLIIFATILPATRLILMMIRFRRRHATLMLITL